VLINLRKAENDTLNVGSSIKNSRSLLECPTIRLLYSFLSTTKIGSWHRNVEIVLGWQEQDY